MTKSTTTKNSKANDLTTMIQTKVKQSIKVNPSASFPRMLHQCLTDIEELAQRDPAMAKLSEIVGWQKQGTAFRVHDKKQFETLIMPVWFIRLKYSSFVRQLSLYGFKKIHKDTADAQKGAMYHELFLKGRPEMAEGILKAGKNNKQPCVTPKLCQPFCMPPCPQAAQAVPASMRIAHLQGSTQSSASNNTNTQNNGLVNLLARNISHSAGSSANIPAMMRMMVGGTNNSSNQEEQMPEIEDTSNLIQPQHNQQLNLILQNMDLNIFPPASEEQEQKEQDQVLAELLEPTPFPPLNACSSFSANNNSNSLVLDNLLDAQGINFPSQQQPQRPFVSPDADLLAEDPFPYFTPVEHAQHYGNKHTITDPTLLVARSA